MDSPPHTMANEISTNFRGALGSSPALSLALSLVTFLPVKQTLSDSSLPHKKFMPTSPILYSLDNCTVSHLPQGQIPSLLHPLFYPLLPPLLPRYLPFPIWEHYCLYYNKKINLYYLFDSLNFFTPAHWDQFFHIPSPITSLPPSNTVCKHSWKKFPFGPDPISPTLFVCMDTQELPKTCQS